MTDTNVEKKKKKERKHKKESYTVVNNYRK